MELKDIASISGKGGLFKVPKPTRTGVVLETLDAQKKRLVASAHERVSILKEISIYTNTEEGSVLLEDIYDQMHKKFGKDLPVQPKSTPAELMSFVEEVIPDFDRERVYPSDIKKMVSWYNALLNFAPELFEAKEKAPAKKKAEAKTEKPEAKKPAAKKAPAKKKTVAEKKD